MTRIKAGDVVEVRDSSGDWHRTTARSSPRVDHANSFGQKQWESVAVDWPSGREGWVNWPTEDVRPVDEPGESDA